MSLENTFGLLLVRDAAGSTELIGVHWMAVVVLVVLILVLYPSISKLLTSAPGPADVQKFAENQLKAQGRIVRQNFSFGPSNNRMLTERTQPFLGVPEAPNFSGDVATDQILHDVTLDSIKAEGGSGLGSLGDLAKADMVAADAQKFSAKPGPKFAPLGI
jgi:hypothetical protein